MPRQIVDVRIPSTGAEADDDGHCLVRTGFVRALLRDPRVLQAIVECDSETDLLRCAIAKAEHGNILAQLAGLVDHAALDALSDPEIGAALDRVPETPATQAAFDQWQRARSLIPQVYARITGAQLARYFAPLVHTTLGLRWRWLVDDLMAHYEQRFWSLMFGRPIELHYVVDVPLDVALEWAPGESGDDARGRYDAALARAKARYEAAKRRLQNEGLHLEEWGRFFYLLKVQQPPEPTRHLAQAVQAKGDYRTGLRRAVRIAEQYLSLHP